MTYQFITDMIQNGAIAVLGISVLLHILRGGHRG